jgi:hypothetical protein
MEEWHLTYFFLDNAKNSAFFVVSAGFMKGIGAFFRSVKRWHLPLGYSWQMRLHVALLCALCTQTD